MKHTPIVTNNLQKKIKGSSLSTLHPLWIYCLLFFWLTPLGCKTNYQKETLLIEESLESKQQQGEIVKTEEGGSIEIIASKLLEKIGDQKKNIAVIEFSQLVGDSYKSSPKGKLISERLITKLVNSGKVTVVERGQLQKVLNELKLNMEGIIDSSSAKKVGNILGIDALVTGTIIELEKKSEINTRMIDTENGTIIAAVTVQDVIELHDTHTTISPPPPLIKPVQVEPHFDPPPQQHRLHRPERPHRKQRPRLRNNGRKRGLGGRPHRRRPRLIR